MWLVVSGRGVTEWHELAVRTCASGRSTQYWAAYQSARPPAYSIGISTAIVWVQRARTPGRWRPAAKERAGVRAFVYASSVAVYGSGLRRDMLEDAPVLTPDRDVRSEYWAVDQLRAYGRTKLGGELAIREAAASVRYVVFRPTVVVDIDDVIAIRDWGKVKRNLAAHRHAHHVYVRDVADAFSWAVARGLAGTTAPGSVETYNLGEDEFVEPTHADFMRKAYTVNGNARFRAITVPWPVDWLRDALKFRSLPLRNPLWRMRFPSGRLHAAGWRPPFGMAGVHDAALRRIEAEAPGDRPQ